MTPTPRTLYLCYFGLREPLVQTQVLPYLRQLAGGGVEVSLLTFEPHLATRWTQEELDATREQLAREGVRWFRLPYHKSPTALATAYDILAGAREAVRIARRHRITVLHARAHVPVAMAMLAAKRLPGVRIVFDIRGLMAEEYADAGVWPEHSRLFRAVKKLERAGIRRADGIVVLTERMRDWLVGERLASAEKIEVIPCCVDFSRYESSAATGNKPSNDVTSNESSNGATGSEPSNGATMNESAGDGTPPRFEVVYAGSVTGLYMLEEMGRFFLELRARREGAFFRVLTTSSAEAASAILRGVGLREDDFHVGAVSAAEVPSFLRRACVGVSFRKPTFSQLAASPTKIPEYLAAGLPVVSNFGIGDTDELLEGERVGVVVRGFDRDSLARAADDALALVAAPDIASRCREAARRHFDLVGVGGARYLNVYRRLGG